MFRRELIRLLATSAATVFAAQHLPASVLQQEETAPSETLLPLFPLALVLFPRTTLPLHIFEERYKEMIADCLRNQSEFGIVLVQRSLETIGCTARISEVLRSYPDGRMDILVIGQRRFEISSLNRDKSYLRGTPRFFEDESTESPALEIRQQAVDLYRHLIELFEEDDPSAKASSAISSPNDLHLSFLIMAELPAELNEKQEFLKLRSEGDRLARVILKLQQLIEYMGRVPARTA